jgi:DNA-binding transcriptional regulator YhcF (GntR family)
LQKSIINNNGISKYIQLKQIAIEMITDKYETGSRFLSERELMKKFKVSSATVSKAMKALIDENILERRVGAGSYVKNISNIKIHQENITTLPTLIFSTFYREPTKSNNPLHWFIVSEINNGIMSNYSGRCLMKSISEIITIINSGERYPLILVDPSTEDINAIDKSSVPYVIINQNINAIDTLRPNSVR